MDSRKILLFAAVATLILCGCGGEPGRYYGDEYSIKFPRGWDVQEINT